METLAKPKEIPEVFSPRDSYVTQPGDSVEVIAAKLWIRLAGIPKGIWSIQPWDKFELQLWSKWIAILKKSRPETTPWTKLEASFQIEGTKVYQDVEKWPKWFPYISFRRNPQRNIYTMLDTQWGLTDIEIPTANLDKFKDGITKISGVLITECGARKNELELSCNISGVRWFDKVAFKLNDSWYRFFFDTHHVDMTQLYNLTANSKEWPNPYYILKELISSLPWPIQIAPTQTAKK